MRSLNDTKLKAGDYLRYTWYFEKWWEKAIMVILSALGVLWIVQKIFGF